MGGGGGGRVGRGREQQYCKGEKEIQSEIINSHDEVVVDNKHFWNSIFLSDYYNRMKVVKREDFQSKSLVHGDCISQNLLSGRI